MASLCDLYALCDNLMLEGLGIKYVFIATEALGRPNKSAVTRLMQDATLMKKDFPLKNTNPQIIVPRSKESLISAVYLL